MSGYPPRLGHLATRAVVVEKLLPTYAHVHQVDDAVARERLASAFSGGLWEDTLQATWDALRGGSKRLSDDGLLEKVADTLRERPLRPGRRLDVTPAYSAFLLLCDVQAGTASDAARKVLESEAGHARAVEGLREAGAQLARELTRGR